MKILVVIPSKSTKDPLICEGLDYLAKTRPPLNAEAIFLAPKSQVSEAQKDARMMLEGEMLLKKTAGYFRIALSENGRAFSSVEFAHFLEKTMHHSSKIAFIIGGAFGLSAEVLKQSDATLSLSLMTYPHRLAFLLLGEQIFRASEILNRTPYHKQ